MGYTHYWERPPALPPAAFTRAVADGARLLPLLGIPLAGPDGTGTPVLEAREIVFNGPGAAGYETFSVRRDQPDGGAGRPVFGFCKTARQPYDLAVQVALIVLRHHLGKSFRVSSDGDGADWEQARGLCQEHLGYGWEFRLDEG